MISLADKTAIVTGGASGIGAAIVRRFTAEGARVIIADRNPDAGTALARDCGAQFVSLDVSDPFSWNALHDAAVEAFDGLDILVNSAGIMSHQSIEELDLDSWRRVMAVNLDGPMLGCKTAIALMKRKPVADGSIITISSTASRGAIPTSLAYSVSKSGVNMLSKAVAGWCARQGLAIRSNIIIPGATRTPIHDAALAAAPDPAALLDIYASMSPMRRLAEADELAGLALYLASDEAGFVTGAEFVADGGMLCLHPGT